MAIDIDNAIVIIIESVTISGGTLLWDNWLIIGKDPRPKPIIGIDRQLLVLACTRSGAVFEKVATTNMCLCDTHCVYINIPICPNVIYSDAE